VQIRSFVLLMFSICSEHAVRNPLMVSILSASCPVLSAACDAVSLDDLRQRIARLERAGRPMGERAAGHMAFGVPGIDGALPGGGLPLGALHEVCGAGPDSEHATCAALWVGGLLARARGTVVWALERADVFAPALAGIGLHPDRVVYAAAGKQAEVLAVMEEALRHRGLAAVVGEISGRLSLTASRRLQLSAETSGVVAFVVRRSRRHDDPAFGEPSAAVTRWRVVALPSPPDPLPGLGRACWRLELVRCRGGVPAAWNVEACDATGRLALAADVADRSYSALGQRATG
jgi:protein ImuA